VVAVLGLVLVVVLAIGTVLLLKRDDNDKPAAAATKPSSPQAVEFRRVLKAEQGTCPSPPADGTACDANGMRYSLGKVELDGSHVSEVKAAHREDGSGSWYVGLTLDQAGTELFGRLTSDLAAKQPPANQLAIVVRDEVVMAPAVNAPISGSKVEISGSYTQKDVEALAARITG
jgi:preprotein translocase subunit SecD